jgi:hypothetical protein
MIDNFEKIINFLDFPNKDTFYYVTVMKRKKENPNLGSDSYVLKSYYISSKEYLEKKKDELIHLATYHNARVCICLNKRSYKRVGMHMLKNVTDCILNENYAAIRKAYESTVGKYSCDDEMKELVDIDTKDMHYINEVISYINFCDPKIGDKIKLVLETKNGYHLITKKFNKEQFKKSYKNIDLHSDNPTILYIP